MYIQTKCFHLQLYIASFADVTFWKKVVMHFWSQSLIKFIYSKNKFSCDKNFIEKLLQKGQKRRNGQFDEHELEYSNYLIFIWFDYDYILIWLMYFFTVRLIKCIRRPQEVLLLPTTVMFMWIINPIASKKWTLIRSKNTATELIIQIVSNHINDIIPINRKLFQKNWNSFVSIWVLHFALP